MVAAGPPNGFVDVVAAEPNDRGWLEEPPPLAP